MGPSPLAIPTSTPTMIPVGAPIATTAVSARGRRVRTGGTVPHIAGPRINGPQISALGGSVRASAVLWSRVARTALTAVTRASAVIRALIVARAKTVARASPVI